MKESMKPYQSIYVMINLYHVVWLALLSKYFEGWWMAPLFIAIWGFHGTRGEERGMTADIEKMAFVLRFICLTMTSLCERRLATS